MDKVNRACLVQTGSARSKRVRLHHEVSSDRPLRRADIRDKQARPLFLRATHDIRCVRPCFCRSGLSMLTDAFLGLCSVLLGAQRSAAAEDRVVCGLLAYSHNRKSRRLLSRPGDLSNFASRDETRARLLLERIRTQVSCCSRCRRPRNQEKSAGHRLGYEIHSPIARLLVCRSGFRRKICGPLPMAAECSHVRLDSWALSLRAFRSRGS
jgi:hypothetical protein